MPCGDSAPVSGPTNAILTVSLAHPAWGMRPSARAVASAGRCRGVFDIALSTLVKNSVRRRCWTSIKANARLNTSAPIEQDRVNDVEAARRGPDRGRPDHLELQPRRVRGHAARRADGRQLHVLRLGKLHRDDAQRRPLENLAA